MNLFLVHRHRRTNSRFFSVHWALRAYQELLLTLAVMMSHSDETIGRAARQLEANIFYLEQYRDILPILLREFHETKFTRYALCNSGCSALFSKMFWCFHFGIELSQNSSERLDGSTKISFTSGKHAWVEGSHAVHYSVAKYISAKFRILLLSHNSDFS